MKLEHHYKIAVDAAIERNQRLGHMLLSNGSNQLRLRRVELERRLQGDNTISEERKQRQLQQLGKKESVSASTTRPARR
jgi:hypothetical protein